MSLPADPDLSALSPLAHELAATIARIASDIALVIDNDGVISSVAEGPALKSQGFGQWVGQRWIDTVSADTRSKIQSLLDEVGSRGVGSRRREVNHPALGGDDLMVTWSAIRLGADGPVLAAGRDLRVVAAIQQRFIAAQQDMERQYWRRREAENRYQLLYQVAHDAVLLLEAESLQVLSANAAAASLLGQDLNGLVGRRLTDSLPLPARAAVVELVASSRSNGRDAAIRVRALGLGTLDFSVTPLRIDGQHHVLLHVRREDEAGIDDPLALARMADFVETTPDGIVVTDSAGRILMTNPAFLSLTRCTEESQLRGRALTELLSDADHAWARLVARASSTGLVADVALELDAPGGDSMGVRVWAALLAEGEQPCLGFVLRPGRRLPLHLAGQDVLEGLLDQVGRVPLAELLVEVAHRAERQFLERALLRARGERGAAAQSLVVTRQVLEQRMQRHGLDGLTYPTPVGDGPTLIN